MLVHKSLLGMNYKSMKIDAYKSSEKKAKKRQFFLARTNIGKNGTSEIITIRFLLKNFSTAV